MFDALKGTYTFACPSRGESSVRLSAFRVLDRLEPDARREAVRRLREEIAALRRA